MTQVNSRYESTVNRPVSPEGLRVLHVLAGTAARDAEPWAYRGARTAGGLELADLRGALYRPGRTSGVAKASLSRTLRRLWLAGLVELYDRPWAGPDAALSRCHWEAQRRLAHAEADPDQFYQDFRANFAAFDRYGSAAAFLEHKRAQAKQPHRGFYVRYVQITEPGRSRLTSACTAQLTATRGAA